jgi:hypothetical protein
MRRHLDRPRLIVRTRVNLLQEFENDFRLVEDGDVQGCYRLVAEPADA